MKIVVLDSALFLILYPQFEYGIMLWVRRLRDFSNENCSHPSSTVFDSASEIRIWNKAVYEKVKGVFV